jgi:hypothetical protein
MIFAVRLYFSDRCLADVDMMFLVTMANIQGENVRTFADHPL